jgi:Bifunctional DNA primase/polymerase, N-terminal
VTGRWERLDAALAYARTGWPVFPCRPESKEPATRNGFYDATTSERQIREWWHKDPARNVAIATGAPGPDVVDVDNHGPDDNGFGTLNHLKREGLVGGYHAVVSTSSDGFHLYYRGSEQGNGSARGYRIDFRSKGGYVVAPPSATPAGQYEVVKHSPAAEARTVSWDAIRSELEPPEPWREPEAPVRFVRVGDRWAARDAVTSVDRLVEWTASRQAGDRNFPLFYAAKQAHIAGQLDGEAVERFVDAARRSGLAGGEREARRTIASAQRSGDRELHPAARSVTPGPSLAGTCTAAGAAPFRRGARRLAVRLPAPGRRDR